MDDDDEEVEDEDDDEQEVEDDVSEDHRIEVFEVDDKVLLLY